MAPPSPTVHSLAVSPTTSSLSASCCAPGAPAPPKGPTPSAVPVDIASLAPSVLSASQRHILVDALLRDLPKVTAAGESCDTILAHPDAVEQVSDAALRLCVSMHLGEGGDHRLLLKEGVNKYFCPPYPMPDVLQRSSSTCSPPTPRGFAECQRVLKAIWTGECTTAEALDTLRSRIACALGLSDILGDDGRYVVTAASGSDAELVPLLLALNRADRLGASPGQGRVHSIVAAAGEVGTGSAPASIGRRISTSAPFLPHPTTSFDLGDPIPSLPHDRISLTELPPRCTAGFLQSDCSEQLERTATKILESDPNTVVLLHGVEGSKTGLRIPGIDVLARLTDRFGLERIVTVIDACQCRSEPSELAAYLNLNCLVLITGSKFFNGVGFSGAVLVPPRIALDMDTLCTCVPDGFHDYMRASDFGSGMPALRTRFSAAQDNLGLLMRWTSAVIEMEEFNRVRTKAEPAIGKWVQSIVTLVADEYASRGLAVLSGDTDTTMMDKRGRLGECNSVIALLCHTPSDPSTPLDADTLKKVHLHMSRDCTPLFPSASPATLATVATPILIGQPVKLGSRGVLRVAMSAPLATRFTEEPLAVAKDDRRILDKLALLLTVVDGL